ncbi:MAG: D-tyrosyl-tRNA(Tyr) deacylase [Deltaproteobacteria bacterium]|nr:D-tyrosyl-tRNA(Tyr) deacylase [Deltaproteobacteria bacterium]
MRCVVQRVSRARVTVDGKETGAIGKGLLVYVGVGKSDDDTHIATLAEKVYRLRVFEDEAGKMALDVAQVGGGVLVISQFTLYGDVRRGRRPSFDGALEPVEAERLYARFLQALRSLGATVASGVFRAMMAVESVNDGPVTILVDTNRAF